MCQETLDTLDIIRQHSKCQFFTFPIHLEIMWWSQQFVLAMKCVRLPAAIDIANFHRQRRILSQYNFNKDSLSGSCDIMFCTCEFAEFNDPLLCGEMYSSVHVNTVAHNKRRHSATVLYIS